MGACELNRDFQLQSGALQCDDYTAAAAEDSSCRIAATDNDISDDMMRTFSQSCFTIGLPSDLY